MFEKFTEKAINVITESQNLAKEMKNSYVQPEHLLLAIFNQAKGVSLKLFKICGITEDSLKKAVETDPQIIKNEKSQINHTKYDRDINRVTCNS